MYTANIIISDPNGSEVRRVTLKNNVKLLYLWEVIKSFNQIFETEYPPLWGGIIERLYINWMGR